ncbi:hypothetical protein WDL1P1_00026 (plasmid) [Variovorax sp. WDL1]|nr:hypothetical protein CHC06_05613 [Variovorax sp. B2]PNG50904.1 hypothetical protein CHC07_05518 [Variovorax sp. B4]VTV17056.1 hypothetical protein WDL1P1_00026 [Variovorax sp. WDL1]
MTRPVHAFVLGAALTLFGQTGVASSLEQSGQPEQSVSVMKTYGVGVATSKGLRTVVPAGWRTYVQPPAALPESMSWKVGQEWTSVLADLAKDSNINVLVDWSSKSVYLRTTEAALDDGAKRAEVLQAATTPLPRFEPKPLAVGVIEKVASTAASSQNHLKTEPLAAGAPAATAADAASKASFASSAALATPLAGEPAGGKFAVRKKTSNTTFDAPLATVTLGPSDVTGRAVETRGTASLGAAPVAQGASTSSAVSDAPEPAEKVLAKAEPAQVVGASPTTGTGTAPVGAVTSGPLSVLEDKLVLKPALGLDLVAAPSAGPSQQHDLLTAPIERPSAEKRMATSAAVRAALAPVTAEPGPFNATVPAPVLAAPTSVVGHLAAPAVVAAARSPEAPVAVAQAEPPVNIALAAQMTEALNAAPTTLLPSPGARIGDTEDFVYTQAVALNKPSARSVAQSIANRFHLRLVWAAPEMTLRGPVTLLGNSAEEDMTLLKKAMGVYSPVSLDIPTGQGVLMAVAQSGSDYPNLAAKAILPAAPGNTDPAGTHVVAGGSVVGQVLGGTGAQPVAAGAPSATDSPVAAVAALELVVNEGEPLEVAIVRFARTNGYTMEWKVDGGFEAKRSLTYKGASVREVLANVLPPLGVSADIYKQESHIVVRPADAALDF